VTAEVMQEKTLGVDVFQALFERTHPIHVLTLVAMGMQLLDNQNLEDLAAACAARSRWEFMLVVAPLKLIGGTASMVNPIAVF
jgi:hypothetical protein